MSANGHTVANTPPILLAIGGFDPSCGAGVVADLKTFAAHGCYGVAAITSLTVQNTQAVEAVHNTPSAELREQLEVLVKQLLAINETQAGQISRLLTVLQSREGIGPPPRPAPLGGETLH